MELALVIGAFVTIVALIALCTCWFFHLHRRYLAVADHYVVSTTTEDEQYSPACLTSTPSISGENRGKKLLLTTDTLDDEASQPQNAVPNGQKQPEKESGIKERTGVEDEEQVLNERFVCLIVQKGAAERPKMEEQPKTEEQLRTEKQLRTEQQLTTTEQQKREDQREESAQYREEGGGGTEQWVVSPDCSQANKEEEEDEDEESVVVRKKKDGAVEKLEAMCTQPSPVEAAPAERLEGGDRLMDPLVRAEVVIGEGTKQLLLETNVTLDRPAIKIRNITAEIRNLTTELIQDKVIIQGVLHKQIFFVGEDNIVHHQSEDVPFSTFIDIFGTEPGMNIQVHPVIETILFSLIRPSLLHQKVVVEFFVKVTESNQLNLVEGAGPLVRLDQVIGEGTKQELLENTVTLNVPALKIDDITAEIRDLTIEVIDDKVIIQGIIHKQIFFIGLDNIEYHQAEDLEFSTFLDIPGATTGMDVVVEPTIEFIHFELLDEETLLQKIVVEFFVKVTESIQINVVLGPGALLKLDTVVGEDTKQLLVENTITLSQPAIKIREIVAKIERLMAEVIEDKVIIQGVVHKQIFFINEDNLEIHQSEDVPFSTFVDIPGAVPGMDVRIKPIIETVLFELLDSTTLRQKVVVELFIKVTESQQLQVQVAAPYGPYYF